MQSQQTASSSDREREELRQLIEQRTKEWESENGKVKTTGIVRKDAVADYWQKSSDAKSAAAEEQVAINSTIAERYPVAECLPTLAADLGVPTVAALHSRASRLKVKRPIINHPNALRANDRAQKVGELLSAGDPPKKVAEKLGMPSRSVRYYRKRLAEINQEADAIEAKINAIASIGKRSHETAG